MGGKPSKGTAADRRLKDNKPAPKPAMKTPPVTPARPVKSQSRRRG